MVDVVVPETSHRRIKPLLFIIGYQLSIFHFKKSQNAVFLVGIIVSSITVVAAVALIEIVFVHNLYHRNLCVVDTFSHLVLDLGIVGTLKSFKLWSVGTGEAGVGGSEPKGLDEAGPE